MNTLTNRKKVCRSTKLKFKKIKNLIRKDNISFIAATLDRVHQGKTILVDPKSEPSLNQDFFQS